MIRDRFGDVALDNLQLAAILDEIATLLESQGTNPYRVSAYRGGAETFRALTMPAVKILDAEGIEGLMRLPRIAPRRFNPTGEAWLPVLHTQRGDRHYTAIYSNTLRAHELGAIRDWVVIYRDDDDDHGRWTVITAHYSLLRGRRIVVGRERECELHYSESHAT